MALDVATGTKIVTAVSSDISCRARIEGPDFPDFIPTMLERLRWAGGVRNFALTTFTSMGSKDAEFVRICCIGIAEITQGVIFRGATDGSLPKVKTARMAERMVNGFAHKATGVTMKDGSDYVFDWWPTLNPRNPLISRYAHWSIAEGGVEYRLFKGFR